MSFEGRARIAGSLAREIAAHVDRPNLVRIAEARRARRLVATGMAALAVLVLGVWFAPRGGTEVATADTSTTTTVAATTTAGPGECLLTRPDGDFTPPGDVPAQPPDLYEALWYGKPGLWTMLPPDGATWTGLPENIPGLFTNKVFWWAEGYDAITDPAAVSVVARNSSGDEFEFSGTDVTSGMRPDIGHFMIAGIDLPAGCWELTGAFGGVSLTFTVEIVG